jgi:hypothetical protein
MICKNDCYIAIHDDGDVICNMSCCIAVDGDGDDEVANGVHEHLCCKGFVESKPII